MNPDYQKEIDELKRQMNELSISSQLPREIETAFRERLNPPLIFTGIVAPLTTPIQIGSIFVNTVLAKVYVATGLNSSSDWSLVN